jgi:hypothetical protein
LLVHIPNFSTFCELVLLDKLAKNLGMAKQKVRYTRSGVFLRGRKEICCEVRNDKAGAEGKLKNR